MHTRKTLLSLFTAALVCAAVLAVFLSWKSPEPPAPAQSAEEKVAVVAPAPPEADMTVFPLAELDDMMDALAEKGLYSDPFLDTARQKLLQFKAEGKTMWGSENWMKSRAYYAALDTPKLVEECFDDSTFYFEMMKFDDPRLGHLELSIMHEGFAELFSREDLSEGLIHAYTYCASKFVPESDLDTIATASMTLDRLSSRLLQVPEIQEAVQGHELEFYEVSLSALKSYRDYLEIFDPVRLGTEMPFFGEASSVASATLSLLGQIDPGHFNEIAPELRAYRWSQDQDMGELKEFLDFAVNAFEKRN